MTQERYKPSHEIFCFLWKYRDSVRRYKPAGMYPPDPDPKENFRNVAGHQVFCALMVYEMAKLMGLSSDQIDLAVNTALVHDIDKKDQKKTKTEEEIIKQEANKTGIDAATSSNFDEFENWGVIGDLLRFADSCTGNEPGPWRERVAGFRINKVKEDQKGYEKYGMRTWDKLTQVTLRVEKNIYNRIVENNQALREEYPNQDSLLRIVSDHIKLDFGISIRV